MVDGWNVVLNGDQYINDLSGADPNVLSSVMALADVITFFILSHACYLLIISADVSI